VRKIAAGRWASAAILRDGTAWTWGSNTTGLLGHGDKTSRWTPALVATLRFPIVPCRAGAQRDAVRVVHALSIGWGHSLFVVSSGAERSLFVCGRDRAGRLGLGDLRSQPTPTHLPIFNSSGGVVDVSHAAAGEEHSIVVSASGDAYGYGSCKALPAGRRGDFTESDVTVPTLLAGISDHFVVHAAAGSTRSVLLTAAGVALALSTRWSALRRNVPFGAPLDHVLRERHGVAPVALGGRRAVAVACDQFCELVKTADGAATAISDQGRRVSALEPAARLQRRQPSPIGMAAAPS